MACNLIYTKWLATSTEWLHYVVGLAMVGNAFYNALDAVTEAFELTARQRSDTITWELLERDLYEKAEIVTLRPNSDRPPCCVLHLKAKKVKRRLGVVFFQHGSMARLSQFSAQIKHFQENGYDVVAMDFPGMGRSPKSSREEDSYLTEELQMDMAALYEKYGSFPSSSSGSKKSGKGDGVVPNFFVGHSYACGQVLNLAADAKHPPAAIVLLGAGIPNPDADSKRKFIFNLPVWLIRIIRPMLSKGFKTRALHPETCKVKFGDFFFLLILRLVELWTHAKVYLSSLQGKTVLHRKLLEFSEATSGSNPIHVCSLVRRSDATFIHSPIFIIYMYRCIVVSLSPTFENKKKVLRADHVHGLRWRR